MSRSRHSTKLKAREVACDARRSPIASDGDRCRPPQPERAARWHFRKTRDGSNNCAQATSDGYPPRALWTKIFIEYYIPEVDKCLAKSGKYKIEWQQSWGGIAGLPFLLSQWLDHIDLGFFWLMTSYVLLLLFLGTIIDTGSIILMCVPLFLRAIERHGTEPSVVRPYHIGLLTPPFGLSCFVIKAAMDRSDISVNDIFFGAFRSRWSCCWCCWC
jgi:hypothetical protein